MPYRGLVTRALILAVLVAPGIAAAGDTRLELAAGPILRTSTDYLQAGLRLSVGHGRADRSSGWHVDLQHTDGLDESKASSLSLRFAWDWGWTVAPHLVIGPGLAFGVDADSFPGDSGYTDSALHLLVVGAEARATLDVTGTFFAAALADGSVRGATVGNRRPDRETFAATLALVIGVRG